MPPPAWLATVTRDRACAAARWAMVTVTSFRRCGGADSYNNGAGMGRVTLAAGFIKGNMPSGITHVNAVLTDEQAFDVSAFVNSQPRPVKARLELDFPARKNKPVDAAFAPYTPGFSADQHKYGPWQPIQAARERGIFPPK